MVRLRLDDQLRGSLEGAGGVWVRPLSGNELRLTVDVFGQQARAGR